MPHDLVVHCKRDEYDVYVGRPSRWGNPYHVGVDGSRAKVIAKYEAWLLEQVATGDITLEDLADLEGKRLACWCAPLICHAAVLVRWSRMAAWILNERSNP